MALMRKMTYTAPGISADCPEVTRSASLPLPSAALNRGKGLSTSMRGELCSPAEPLHTTGVPAFQLSLACLSIASRLPGSSTRLTMKAVLPASLMEAPT